MITILIIIGLIIVIGVYVGFFILDRTGLAIFIATLLNSLILIVYIPLCIPILQVTGGMMPTYSEGYREGCIYKVSTVGVVFKTIECEMQLGGQMLPMATPFRFSIPKDDTNLITKVNASVREMVRVTYREYYITDCRVSDCGYVITGIELINKEK